MYKAKLSVKFQKGRLNMQKNTESITKNIKNRKGANSFFENILPERGGFMKPGITSRFFLMLCVPILIVMFFAYSCNAYYSKQYREMLTSAYSLEMDKFLQSSENEFMNLSKDATLLLSIPAVSHLSYTSEPPDAIAYDEVHPFSPRFILLQIGFYMPTMLLL